jgi:hypothetical protein
MVWLMLEIALGLALFIFIVWWTLPRAKQKRPEEPPDSGH